MSGNGLGDGTWLTLSATASRLGWHLQKAQTAARRGEWPKRRGNAGRAFEYLVPASLLTRAVTQSGAVIDIISDAVPDRVNGSAMLETMPDAVGLGEERVARARAEAVLAELRAVLEHERARGGELAAALAQTQADAQEARLEAAGLKA